MLRCQAVWVSYRCWASTTRWTRQWLFWRVEQRKIPMKGCQGCWASTTKNLILRRNGSWCCSVWPLFRDTCIKSVDFLLYSWVFEINITDPFFGWLIVQMGFLRSSTYCLSLPLGCGEKCRGPAVFDASYDWIYRTWYIHKGIMHIYIYTHTLSPSCNSLVVLGCSWSSSEVWSTGIPQRRWIAYANLYKLASFWCLQQVGVFQEVNYTNNLRQKLLHLLNFPTGFSWYMNFPTLYLHAFESPRISCSPFLPRRKKLVVYALRSPSQVGDDLWEFPSKLWAKSPDDPLSLEYRVI